MADGITTVSEARAIDPDGKFMQVEFNCTGGADNAVPDGDFPNMKGFNLKSIETVPGLTDAVPSAYALNVKNSRGTTIMAVTNRATDAPEIEYPSAEVFIDDTTTLEIGDLGEDNTTKILVNFVKA